MREHRRILELAESGSLPEQIDRQSGIDLAVFRELLDHGSVRAGHAHSKVEGDQYFDPSITLAGRHLLAELRQSDPTAGRGPTTDAQRIRLFISHSSADRQLAGAIADLIRAALRLSASEIRCSSVDGYRLPGGADTAEQLRAEVHDADVLVGLISRASIGSLFVVFELGARWGASKPLIPLLVPGVPPTVMGGPLSGLNALSSESASQLHQLVDDIARSLKIVPEPASSYLPQLNRVRAAPAVTAGKAEPPTQTVADISEPESEVLVALCKAQYETTEELASRLGRPLQAMLFLLERLEERKFVDSLAALGGPTQWTLSKAGRVHLAERGLLT